MYLDSISSIVTCILTQEGRAALARNDGSFRITKFCLSDDEINYALYNPNTDDDTDILNLPILEPSSNGKSALRYRLITLPKGAVSIGYLTCVPTELTLVTRNAVNRLAPKTGVISVQTVEGFDYNGYIAVSRDKDIAFVSSSNINATLDENGNTTAIVTVNSGTKEGTTIIDITGKDTGSIISVPVTVTTFLTEI